ncbi:DUF4440 domain-containing protein [Siccibacter colletis]|uniref:DUF4440 domain-containing protein n=1 Tax=Siccibacter colletis TaxID=1505757 RepID=A0ABY6JL85_9ENTR|nr:DUF4440 domain-containing protein [Siccibacter colletis]UYU33659.1 DUF4440 domain-containing protein [Siccibacter colletis]
MNPYFTEVLDAHVAIEAWLGRGVGDLEALMARFSAAFTLVSPAGTVLDRDGLRTLFTTHQAGRPGLKIDIDSMTLVQAWDTGAAVRYREHQQLADNATTTRWSTAVFSRSEQGLVWCHLHETLVAG